LFPTKTSARTNLRTTILQPILKIIVEKKKSELLDLYQPRGRLSSSIVRKDGGLMPKGWPRLGEQCSNSRRAGTWESTKGNITIRIMALLELVD
jgi:hypothetical protein